MDTTPKRRRVLKKRVTQPVEVSQDEVKEVMDVVDNLIDTSNIEVATTTPAVKRVKRKATRPTIKNDEGIKSIKSSFKEQRAAMSDKHKAERKELRLEETRAISNRKHDIFYKYNLDKWVSRGLKEDKEELEQEVKKMMTPKRRVKKDSVKLTIN